MDLENGDVVQIETGYTNWNRKDNEFNCTVDGRTEKGLVILNAMNAVCFDGRNTIQPYFAVDKETAVLESGMYYKIPGCYVLWNVIGMDRNGRFILKTRKK
jgi:hypothetical protein